MIVGDGACGASLPPRRSQRWTSPTGGRACIGSSCIPAERLGSSSRSAPLTPSPRRQDLPFERILYGRVPTDVRADHFRELRRGDPTRRESRAVGVVGYCVSAQTGLEGRRLVRGVVRILLVDGMVLTYRWVGTDDVSTPQRTRRIRGESRFSPL